jgi:YNFM family putative membrane transporter
MVPPAARARSVAASQSSVRTAKWRREPFGLSPSAIGLVFLLWALGVMSPFAGTLTDRVGWRRMASIATIVTIVALLLSLFATLLTLIAALALQTIAMFVGSTATKLGSATSSETDKGLASAMYFSCYYVSGAAAGFLPGLAWQAWAWPGVVGICLATLVIALVILSRAPGTANDAT